MNISCISESFITNRTIFWLYQRNLYWNYSEICRFSLKYPILEKLAISASTEPIFKILDTFPMFFGVWNWMDTLSKPENSPKMCKTNICAVFGASERPKFLFLRWFAAIFDHISIIYNNRAFRMNHTGMLEASRGKGRYSPLWKFFNFLWNILLNKLN